MKFSIIIPAYHEESFIEKTLASIKHQSFRNYEIIVVLLPSDDMTGEIAKKYADKVIIQKSKEGPGEARNIGARYAEGDVFIFMDADTIVRPDFLEKVCKALKKGNAVMLIPVYLAYDGGFKEKILYAFMSVCSKLTKLAYGILMIVRRDAFFKVGGFDCILSEDIDFSLKLAKLFGRKSIQRSSDLVAYTSSRRVRKIGFLKLLAIWLFSNAKLIFLKKPICVSGSDYWR